MERQIDVGDALRWIGRVDFLDTEKRLVVEAQRFIERDRMRPHLDKQGNSLSYEQLEKLAGLIAAKEKKLSNEGFVSRAPTDVIAGVPTP